MSAGVGPLAAYRALLSEAAEGFIPDADQDAAVRRLQALHDRLTAGLSVPSARRSFNPFARSPRAPKEDPRGIYIHGGVGRGKSMLMDLFFDAARLTPKRRVHHHHFMQEVHSEINRALVSGKETGGDSGLVRYARRLAEGVRLLCFDDFHVTDIGDAMILGPRLEYVKKWLPENWPLAFLDRLHLLPQRDFRLIEGEMRRITSSPDKLNSSRYTKEFFYDGRYISEQNPGDGKTPAANGFDAAVGPVSSVGAIKTDYMRIRNVTLNYDVPNSLYERLGLSSARIYTSIENLHTFTDFPTGNPEARRASGGGPALIGGSQIASVTDGRELGLNSPAGLPLPKIWTLGINLNF